jgi:hypothetical protein
MRATRHPPALIRQRKMHPPKLPLPLIPSLPLAPPPHFRKAIGGPERVIGGQIPHSNLRWRLRHHRRSPTPSARDIADIYVVKLDANGNLQWTRTIGGTGE